MEANMAIGLFNEAKSRAPQSTDWEQDIDRLERLSQKHRREQQIRAAIAAFFQFFRRAPALRAAHV